jgi:cobalt/nickel transport system permease protein
MHISDGILTAKWIMIWYAVAVFFLALGVREIKKYSQENPEYIPKVALMGAAVFVISVWHLPVPVTGSSSHPIGTPLAAILIGGFPTVVVSTIGLFFHMFLAHGGLTTIGANTVSMGIIGTFMGLITYKALRVMGARRWMAAGFAGLMGDISTYAATSMILALSLASGDVLSLWKVFMLGFAPTQLPLAVLEFGFTAGVVHYIAGKRPELLNKPVRGETVA